MHTAAELRDEMRRELAITKDERARAQHACELMGRRITRLEDLVRVLLDNDPDDMAADGVTVLDAWRKDAEAAIRYDWSER